MSLFDTPKSPAHYADVILPVAVPKLFTYEIPPNMVGFLSVGFRVIVPFGSKITTGIINKLHQNPPKYNTKFIDNILDNEPIVSPVQIQFMRWMASYYLCTIGEVLKAVLPSGMKISSESRVQLHPDFDLETTEEPLNEREQLLLAHLSQHPHVDMKEVPKIIGVKQYAPHIKSLIEKQAIIIFEHVKEKYNPKKEKRVRLKAHWAEETALNQLFGLLEKKQKGLECVMRYLQSVNIFDHPELNNVGLEKKALVAQNVSASSIKTLVKNQIMEEFEVQVSRLGRDQIPDRSTITLTEAQEKAKAEIIEGMGSGKPVLFHGITGSGKTEIYIDLIQQALEAGTQVLLMLPEIALTTQIVDRLAHYFGEQMGIYHSKYSDQERVEVWNGVVNGQIQFVVGVRSSLLLPFDNLGLIIVDESHEISYKQHEPNPRYYAADAALILAHLHHCPIIMGSATPSFEQLFLAQEKKYHLVQLTERFGDAQLPKMQLVDISRERKKKTMVGDYSSVLINAIKETVGKGEQVIIFQNRRGYAPILICEDCGTSHQCPNCAVSLTLHQHRNELICHYCGHQDKVPMDCFACGSVKLSTQGFGTQKLEEDLQNIFPDYSIQRMDLDTTRNKNSYQVIIDDFEQQKIDILIGTQIVTKGLDFGGVTLVGVVDADRMLRFPDFRANERAYQMITQVGGRAGRRASQQGRVIIQTRQTDQDVLQKVIQQDFKGLFKQELAERLEFQYPPFRRLIKITIKNPDEQVCQQAALYLNAVLEEWIGKQRVLGAQTPYISKIRNLFLREITIKIEREGVDLKRVKSLIQQAVIETYAQKAFAKTHIISDVDPY
ncbi:replication restart helicase PriA [Persicobacter psychrovividus]|uniref:Replication restart protein PriA n=1 Tax=Persicobacter psychrovividus TaxID=387638 RepID=A0ABN6L6U3_9BACT|nr:primosomal protein N' [Persicobacter psychrovividus]